VVDQAGAVEAALLPALAAPDVGPADLVGRGLDDRRTHALAQLGQVLGMLHDHMVVLLALRMLALVLVTLRLRRRVGAIVGAPAAPAAPPGPAAAAAPAAATGTVAATAGRFRQQDIAAQLDHASGREAAVIRGEDDPHAGDHAVTEVGGQGELTPVGERNRGA